MIELTTPVLIDGKAGMIVARTTPVKEEPRYDLRVDGEAEPRRYLKEGEFVINGDPMPAGSVIREADVILREREQRANLEMELAANRKRISVAA